MGACLICIVGHPEAGAPNVFRPWFRFCSANLDPFSGVTESPEHYERRVALPDRNRGRGSECSPGRGGRPAHLQISMGRGYAQISSMNDRGRKVTFDLVTQRAGAALSWVARSKPDFRDSLYSASRWLLCGSAKLNESLLSPRLLSAKVSSEDGGLSFALVAV